MAQDDANQTSQEFNNNLQNAASAASSIVDALKGFGDTQVFKGLSRSVEAFNEELEKSEGILDKLKKGEIDLTTAQAKQAKVKKLSNSIDLNSTKLEDQIMKKMKNKSAAEKKAVQDKIKGLKDSGKAAVDQMSKFSNLAAKGETRGVKFMTQLSKGAKGMGWDKTAKASGAMAKSLRAGAVAGKGMGKIMGGMAKTLPHMLKGLGAALGPVGWIITGIMLFVDLLKFIMKINSEVISISKNLGISKTEARAFRQHLFNASYASGNILNTQQELLKVHGQLNDAMGTTVVYFQDHLLADTATMQNRLGMSVDASLGIAQNILATSRNTEEFVDLVGHGGVAMANQLGIAIDQWKVQEQVAKTTGQMRAIYSRNEGALGRVVARAQVLGMTMGQIHKMSEGMLNFHSSIEKELKAELFLGKKLNLETARLAALTGDMETFHSEILKNAGDYLDFTRMNVMQQKALADALNMSTDQLADMLFHETKLENMRTKATAQEWDKIKQMRTQMDLQQSFNAAMEQLKMILVDLMDGIEEWVMPDWMAFALGVEGGKVFDGGKGKDPSEFDSEGNPLIGTGVMANDEVRLNDFKITTHPEDTFLMAGGTGAWQSNAQQNQKPIIVNATMAYDGYAAVKAATHHGTGWNRKM